MSNVTGTLPFIAGRFSESRLGRDDSSDAVDASVVDLFDEARDVDLLKMDIEGGEWPILFDQRLGDLAALGLASLSRCRGPRWSEGAGVHAMWWACAGMPLR